MRCSNCGEPIEEGRLFCLNCGQEVQWVPDYDSFGDYMVQEKLKKEKEQAEAAAARKRAAIAAENRRRKKAKKKRMILVSVAGVLVLVAAGLFFKLVDDFFREAVGERGQRIFRHEPRDFPVPDGSVLARRFFGKPRINARRIFDAAFNAVDVEHSKFFHF